MAGWLSGWQKRFGPIKIDAGKIDTANLTWFPALLYLSSSTGQGEEDVTAIFDEVGANSKKIAITKADGITELYAEIKQWDYVADPITDSKAWLWISKDGWVTDKDTDTEVWVYYDNDHADNTAHVGDIGSRTEVWDGNFKGVWHMVDSSGSVLDSTSNPKNLTLVNSPTEVAGQVGKALYFDGVDQYANHADDAKHDITGGVTIGALIKPDGDVAASVGIAGKFDYDANEMSYRLSVAATNRLWGSVSEDGTLGAGHYSRKYWDSPIVKDIWQDIAASYNNVSDTVALHRNSVSGGTVFGTGADDIHSGTAQFFVAVFENNGAPQAATYFKGAIGEIRLLDAERTEEWEKATHHSFITSGANALIKSYGSEEIYDWLSGWEEAKRKTVPITGAGSIAGTIGVTNNSTQVDGTGTTFTDWSIGDQIQLPNSNWYTIDSITDDDTLDITVVYPGSTASGESYTFHRINYQVKIEVHSGSGSDSAGVVYLDGGCTDFPNDIRFTLNNGITEITHKLVHEVGGVAEFWLEMPTVSAAGTTDYFKIYYGKSGAASASSDSALEFVDDFAGWDRYAENPIVEAGETDPPYGDFDSLFPFRPNILVDQYGEIYHPAGSEIWMYYIGGQLTITDSKGRSGGSQDCIGLVKSDSPHNGYAFTKYSDNPVIELSHATVNSGAGAVGGAALDDGGSVTDFTTEANNPTVGNVNLLPAAAIAVGDAFYVGHASKHIQTKMLVSTAGTGYTLVHEYSKGGGVWTAVPTGLANFYIDNLDQFKRTGKKHIYYSPDKCTDWATTNDIDADDNKLPSTVYWERWRVTATDGEYTAPKATQIWVALEDDPESGDVHLSNGFYDSDASLYKLWASSVMTNFLDTGNSRTMLEKAHYYYSEDGLVWTSSADNPIIVNENGDLGLYQPYVVKRRVVDTDTPSVITDGGGIDDSQTTFGVTEEDDFVVGMTIITNDEAAERMQVTGVTDNESDEITVIRGVGGTDAAAHAQNTDIDYIQYQCWFVNRTGETLRYTYGKDGINWAAHVLCWNRNAWPFVIWITGAKGSETWHGIFGDNTDGADKRCHFYATTDDPADWTSAGDDAPHWLFGPGLPDAWDDRSTQGGSLVQINSEWLWYWYSHNYAVSGMGIGVATSEAKLPTLSTWDFDTKAGRCYEGMLQLFGLNATDTTSGYSVNKAYTAPTGTKRAFEARFKLEHSLTTDERYYWHVFGTGNNKRFGLNAETTVAAGTNKLRYLHDGDWVTWGQLVVDTWYRLQIIYDEAAGTVEYHWDEESVSDKTGTGSAVTNKVTFGSHYISSDEYAYVNYVLARKYVGGGTEPSVGTAGVEEELHLGSATLSGVGTLAAAANVWTFILGAATLSGVGTLAGIGHITAIGKATLSGIGTLASSGLITAIGKATLAGVGTLSAALTSVKTAAATLAGMGTLAGIAHITAVGKATLSGVGTLSSSGIITAVGKAVLAGVGTLTAIGRLITRGLSDYMEDAIINFMRGEAFPSSAQAYLALFTSESGLEENNPTSEVSGGAYARQALTLDAPSNGETENSADIWFPKATAGWGAIACAAIVDHPSNSNWGVDVNVLMTLAVGDILTIESGDRFKLPAGDLDVAIV